MPKLCNNESNVFLEINLLNNNYLDVQTSRQDYENWIPFEFVLNIAGEEYDYNPERGSTFSLYEIHNLITRFEQIADEKRLKQCFEKFEFSSSECYFDIIVYDTLEAEEVYLDIWINIGMLTNGELYGCDKGFRFVVQLNSFFEFTNGLRIQLNDLLGL